MAYAIPVEQIYEALGAAAEEVLDLMFFTTVLSSHASAPESVLPVSAELKFLGEEPGTLSPEQIGSVVCELANMICGAVLTRVHADNMFELTSPRLQPSEQGVRLAQENTRRVFDTGDGLLEAYLKVD